MTFQSFLALQCVALVHNLVTEVRIGVQVCMCVDVYIRMYVFVHIHTHTRTHTHTHINLQDLQSHMDAHCAAVEAMEGASLETTDRLRALLKSALDNNALISAALLDRELSLAVAVGICVYLYSY